MVRANLMVVRAKAVKVRMKVKTAKATVRMKVKAKRATVKTANPKAALMSFRLPELFLPALLPRPLGLFPRRKTSIY